MRTARIYVPNVQLRERRQRRNLTLEEVADALTALAWERFAVRVGVNAGMVGKWERARSDPAGSTSGSSCCCTGCPPTSSASNRATRRPCCRGRGRGARRKRRRRATAVVRLCGA
jgi:hypothetical protein